MIWRGQKIETCWDTVYTGHYTLFMASTVRLVLNSFTSKRRMFDTSFVSVGKSAEDALHGNKKYEEK